jgi:hypothetical protein
MILFEPSDSPIRHRPFTRYQQVQWYTWAPTFLQDVKELKIQLAKIKPVKFVYLKQQVDYNYTYTVNLSKLNKDFYHHFKNYAYALYHFDPGNNILFFTDLINSRVHGKLFHFMFALMRAYLVEITGDEMAALNSPLTAGKGENDFPLHCDLYVPHHLFNVMEQVADHRSGHSTFIQTSVLWNDILPQVKNMDTKTRKYLHTLVHKTIRSDNYDRFFGTLYDEKWEIEVKQLLKKQCLRIRLEKGEGYLLNDRLWMHGRDITRGGVSSKRLHRLIYNSFLTR